MEERNWLSGLKAGDSVIINRAHWGTKLSVVEKITPSGMIKVDGRMFSKTGHERGNDGRGGLPRASLKEATEEAVKHVGNKVSWKW